MNNAEEQLRYPIGKFTPKEAYTSDEISANIKAIEGLPAKVESLVRQLSPAQLELTYRDGGWSARQVIHHLADSHLNAYIRIKWTLTEDTPVIKAYDEKRWAETAEIAQDPLVSIAVLKAIQAKLTLLLERIPKDEMKKSFIHPATQKNVTIERMTALYAWHGEHHLGHLKIIAAKH
jgi:hypothetical protein